MHIAICDDDHSVHAELISYIKSFFSAAVDDLSFDSFMNAEDFLASADKYDIVFMDVYMEAMNGVDAISSLKEEKNTDVVFISTSRDFAVDAFRLHAQHYLLKPLTEEKVHSALSRCLEHLHTAREPMLSFTSSSGIVALPYSRIIFIESINKRVFLHSNGKVYSSYTTLSTLLEELPSDIFMKAQRSFIVNMGHITEFYFDHIILDSGENIMLSRNHQSELKNQYQTFLFQLTRRGR